MGKVACPSRWQAVVTVRDSAHSGERPAATRATHTNNLGVDHLVDANLSHGPTNCYAGRRRGISLNSRGDFMARISLIEEAAHPELAELIARIKAGRRGGLLNVYKLLLHSPALAQTWFDHNGAVRWHTKLSGRLREIIIIRVAHLNGVDYVLAQHVPGLAVAEGLTLAECEALANWRATDLFDRRERAALGYAEAMTLSTSVSDEVFADVRRHFDDREIVDLSVLIGTYIMHNRVMKALAIDLEPESNRGR
jgi:alkylhydroperoxidase family enzyme